MVARPPDDAELTPADAREVRSLALQLLRKAGALDRFPAPIDDILEAANLSVARESLDAGFLRRMYKGATKRLRKAVGKVLGLLHAPAREIFLDETLRKPQLPWIKLHEVGHSYLPWQQKMYAVVADCRQSLDPDVAQRFEAEANLFAGECLFKGGAFAKEAQDDHFGVLTPVNLAGKYGAGIYASVRRYVTTHPRACAVIVLNKPQTTPELGFHATFRRFVASPEFLRQYGTVACPEVLTPSDGPLGALIPVGRRQRMSGRREMVLENRNGTQHVVVGESFTNTYQVFILLMPAAALKTSVLVP